MVKNTVRFILNTDLSKIQQIHQHPCALLSTFSNEIMKPFRLLDHFNNIHSHKKDKDLEHFQNLKKKCINNYQNFFGGF